jgi:predicted transcriptional regulator YdeE
MWTDKTRLCIIFCRPGRKRDIRPEPQHVYGEWIHADGRKRGNGPDIERYDDRFNPTGENSEFEIMVPLATKK